MTPVYSPQVRFYCETSESGGFRGITKILNAGINAAANGISKSFTGSLYSNLEDPNRIYYCVNGNFYNNGTSSVSAGISVGIGQSASVNLSGGYSTNHFAYSYKEGHIHF